MADDEAWRSMMGDSDDDGEDDFEGFTLQEMSLTSISTLLFRIKSSSGSSVWKFPAVLT